MAYYYSFDSKSEYNSDKNNVKLDIDLETIATSNTKFYLLDNDTNSTTNYVSDLETITEIINGPRNSEYYDVTTFHVKENLNNNYIGKKYIKEVIPAYDSDNFAIGQDKRGKWCTTRFNIGKVWPLHKLDTYDIFSLDMLKNTQVIIEGACAENDFDTLTKMVELNVQLPAVTQSFFNIVEIPRIMKKYVEINDSTYTVNDIIIYDNTGHKTDYIDMINITYAQDIFTIACLKSNITVMQWILDNYTNYTNYNDYMFDANTVAVASGHSKPAVLTFLKNNLREFKYDHNAIDLACYLGNVDNIKWWFENYQTDNLLYTTRAINIASYNGNLEILDIFNKYNCVNTYSEYVLACFANKNIMKQTLQWWLFDSKQSILYYNSNVFDIYFDNMWKKDTDLLIDILNMWKQSGYKIKYSDRVIECINSNIDILTSVK